MFHQDGTNTFGFVVGAVEQGCAAGFAKNNNQEADWSTTSVNHINIVAQPDKSASPPLE